MKQLFFLSLVFLTCSLSAQNTPRVITTATMIADMAQTIAGEHLEVVSIVPVGGDPHTYEPTPSDARIVSQAELIFINGLTFEGWLNELVDNSGTKAKVVTVTEGVSAIESALYKNATDPHAWMAIDNGLVYIENIKNALIEYDPAHQADYEANYQQYRAELEAMDQYIFDQIKTIPQTQRILITSHDAFQYFGRRYGIRLESVMGTSTEADVQTSDVIRVNEVIRNSQVPAVFIESTIAPKFLEQMAKDNNVKIGGKLYSDSLGKKGSSADTYLKMMKHNTDTLVEALSQRMSSEAPIIASEEKSSSGNLLYILLIGVLFIGGFFFVFKNLNG